MSNKHIKFISALKAALKNKNLKLISKANDLLVVQNENKSIIKIQLIISEPVDIERQGSQNGNSVAGIGVFSFEWPPINNTPEYFILAFENQISRNGEFVFIESSELCRRLEARKRIHENQAYFWLWMMDDRRVYETTNISLEESGIF